VLVDELMVRLRFTDMGLTNSELVVLQAAADGLTAKQTGEKIRRSPETVKHHFKGIYSKLNANNKTHAVAIGFRQGLIK
jgi:DNA-binding NarL/FixJ family response regulator